MNQPEHQLQVSCINWMRYQHPKRLIFAIPNGGNRNVITAKKLKAEGVKAGIPDLFMAVPNTQHNGLFIELKAGKNKPTDKQNEVIEHLKSAGYRCEVINNFDDFRKTVNDYLKDNKTNVNNI